MTLQRPQTSPPRPRRTAHGSNRSSTTSSRSTSSAKPGSTSPSGLSAAEARRRALARFGPVPLAADQCRDARGISFFETLARDVAFALRTLRRAPLVALTVVSTIALGLGVVAVAFTFFNAFFFRVDAVRNPDELFAVERPERPGSRSEIPFTPAGVRGASPRNGRVHGRRGRPSERFHAHRRPRGSRHVRLRQLLRHARCHRGARTDADAG